MLESFCYLPLSWAGKVLRPHLLRFSSRKFRLSHSPFKGPLSLSRSRWLSPSALFPFQGPSQSERVFPSRITPRGSTRGKTQVSPSRALRACLHFSRVSSRIGPYLHLTCVRAWGFGLFALLPFGMVSTPSSFKARLGITHGIIRFGLHRILQVVYAASRRRDAHDVHQRCNCPRLLLSARIGLYIWRFSPGLSVSRAWIQSFHATVSCPLGL